jgi:hypothetical protein
MSTSDQTLFSNIQTALIEPPDGGQRWPSGLWGRDEVISLANLRQDRLLFDTLLLVGISAPLPVAIGQHRVALPDDWLRTVSVVWRGNDGTVRELPRSDSFEADHTISTWESANAAYPLVYDEDETPTLTVQIAPAPTVAGTLDLFYVPEGTELNGNGELLVVPDELEHAVRYGTLVDLLSKDGRGKDPARAAYCAQRFDLAIALTKIILQGWA